MECTPGTLLLHPCYHIHGNRFGRTGAVVLNLTLADERPMAHLSVLQVSDLQEAVATFALADQNAFPGIESWELEYRAKLVELAQVREVSAERLGYIITTQGDDLDSPHTADRT